MTARRSLTPAARGVSLAVLAALRAGRVDLADQADGSTLATSTAPDGTELLRATLRMPVRGAADPRQLTLGAVSLTPQPAEVPPAPVAAPAGEEPEASMRVRSGDLVEVDGVTGAVSGVSDDDGILVRLPGGDVVVLESDLTRIGEWEWRAARRAPPPEPEAPAPQGPPRVEHNGIAVGDVATLDDEDFRVTTADEFGWQGVTVATTPRGRPLANVHCDWDDVERVGDRAWRTLPKREKLRSPIVDGPPVSKGAAKSAKKVAKPKAPKAAAIPELPQGDDAPEVRLWIREAEWDALDDATRTEFEEPIGGSGVDWQGREGWVTALVPADEILTALRGMAAAVGITLHEGDAPPAAKRARAKAAKAVPARNVPVPEADALAIYGEISFVGQEVDGGPWELAAHGQSMPSRDETWATCRASYVRVREYTRGKRCSRDTKDGAR